MPPLSREQARALDRRAVEEFGIPSILLMENAGRGMAELLVARRPAGAVVVCCGKGNNGGDGLVIARHLDGAGVAVRVLLCAEAGRLAGDAAVQLGIVVKSGLPLEVVPGALTPSQWAQKLAGAEWVIDALYGSGLVGPVRPPLDALVAAINGCGAKILAVDIPSGLDADTGEPTGPAVRADLTATVVAPKLGFAAPAAAAYLGRVEVVGMGAPRALLAKATRGAPAP